MSNVKIDVVSPKIEKKEVPSFKFKSIYINNYEYEEPKYDHVIKTYKVLPPYAKDPNTGKLLNDSSELKKVESGSYNLDDDIQSYAKEVDLYHILEKFAASGCNPDLVNKVKGQFGDISNIPDNFNDVQAKINKSVDNFDKVPNELKSSVLNENLSNEDLQAQFDEFIKSRLIQASSKVDNDKDGEK